MISILLERVGGIGVDREMLQPLVQVAILQETAVETRHVYGLIMVLLVIIGWI